MIHILFAAALLAQATPEPTMTPEVQTTAAPSPLPSTPPTTAPKSNNGKHLGQIKHLRTGTLTPSQVRYALTHQLQEAEKLRSMHAIKFDNLRIYRAPASLLKGQHASVSQVAYEPFSLGDAVAQSTLGSFLNIIANVTIQDALNNTLNNNNVSVSLSDVLNSNNIAIGQVAGVYVNSGGIITTIIH